MGNRLCTDKCVDYCVSKIDHEYHCSHDLQFFGMDGLFGILASLSTCRNSITKRLVWVVFYLSSRMEFSCRTINTVRGTVGTLKNSSPNGNYCQLIRKKKAHLYCFVPVQFISSVRGKTKSNKEQTSLVLATTVK